MHLLACMDHATRAVLAQQQVGGAPEEVPGVRSLLAGLDLAGVVVTADALHTHADAAELLVAGKQAHYLLTVKANQPTLLAGLQRLPWQRVPVADRTCDCGHGRIEQRTLEGRHRRRPRLPPRRPGPQGRPHAHRRRHPCQQPTSALHGP
jgi:hypothetical protein